MQGVSGVFALLALCLMSQLWRCSADCDVNIENKIKAEHRDTMEFFGLYDTSLTGEYQIRLMSSGRNIVDKQGDRCLRMEFTKELTSGDWHLNYTDIENGDFNVTFEDGALIAIVSASDGDRLFMLSHRIVYLTNEVVAFYACTDAGNDSPLSVVAVASRYSKKPRLVLHKVQKAKEALERVGVHGFATVPYCT